MKAAQVLVGLAAFLAGGASSFVITRGLVGAAGGSGGMTTREGLVAATIEGVNAGDREALLGIMVGPASDRVAAACDDEGQHDAEARDQRRGERVDDALGEARRRKLVLDHIGDDRAEVVAKSGDELDKHCKARIDVVKHAMELALHDGKNIAYTAQLTAIEVAGRWYLAKIPVAEPVGSKPVAAAAPPEAAPPPDAATPAAAPVLDEVQSLSRVDLAQAPSDCATYVTELQRLRACTTSPETRTGLTAALEQISDELLGAQGGSHREADEKSLRGRCKQGLDMLRKGLFGC